MKLKIILLLAFTQAALAKVEFKCQIRGVGYAYMQATQPLNSCYDEQILSAYIGYRKSNAEALELCEQIKKEIIFPGRDQWNTYGLDAREELDQVTSKRLFIFKLTVQGTELNIFDHITFYPEQPLTPQFFRNGEYSEPSQDIE